MPLTILHISTRLILGGSQENTVLSCEGQARLGHSAHLAFGPIFGPEGSLLKRAETFRTTDDRAIGCHEVPDMVREVSPLRDRRCLQQLRALNERLKPDVIHTHSSKAGVLGRIAGWDARNAEGERAAVVHTIHGPPFMPVEGGLINRLKVRTKNAIYTLAERRAARSCHAIVSVADAMTQQFLARGIGRPAQYVTVRSGMEVETFLTPGPGEDRDAMRAQLGIAPEHFVIGTVARLAEHKGHDDILSAIGDDLRANPHWRLLWVGDGWWRERLLARVAAMGLADRVITTGLVAQERVPAHMRAMDVLCHASYREGLPRTVPQALLCGVPVVANDVDGTREACIEGETGLLVPAGDILRLREALVALAGDPARRASLGARGRERCRVEFASQTMVDRLEDVYANAIARARG